jgi:hypothetical protein
MVESAFHRETQVNSWERYLARSFELRMEYASEEARIRRCWLRYYKQTLLLEKLCPGFVAQ